MSVRIFFMLCHVSFIFLLFRLSKEEAVKKFIFNLFSRHGSNTYTNRESKCKGSKERQGPTLGVRFTEVLIF